MIVSLTNLPRIILKRYCKHIDITNWQTIYPFVEDCVHRHYKRHDFKQLLLNHGLTRWEYIYAIEKHDKTIFRKAIENISKNVANRIKKHNLQPLPEAKIRTRYDPCCRKERQIGWEPALQQVFDFIAVGSSMEIFDKRISSNQAACMKSRGQIYGVNRIQKWIRKAKCAEEYCKRHKYHYNSPVKYFVKLDIHKCFPSMRYEHFLYFFIHDCGNRDIIWLWETLFKLHKVNNYEGFMIGSLISQWAVQYLMSIAYNYIMNIYRTHNGKRVQLVKHCMMFMDDVLLIGGNRHDILTAVYSYTHFMKNHIGVRIKQNYSIKELTNNQGIDMMGFVIYKNAKK